MKENDGTYKLVLNDFDSTHCINKDKLDSILNFYDDNIDLFNASKKFLIFFSFWLELCSINRTRADSFYENKQYKTKSNNTLIFDEIVGELKKITDSKRLIDFNTVFISKSNTKKHNAISNLPMDGTHYYKYTFNSDRKKQKIQNIQDILNTLQNKKLKDTYTDALTDITIIHFYNDVVDILTKSTESTEATEKSKLIEIKTFYESIVYLQNHFVSIAQLRLYIQKHYFNIFGILYDKGYLVSIMMTAVHTPTTYVYDAMYQNMLDIYNRTST